MNEQKKKKIYIGIIVVCALITGYVLFSMNSSPSVPPIDQTVLVPISTTPRTSPTLGGDPALVEFSAPAVFPADNKFFTQVLDSDEYTSLTDFDRINVSPEELDRDDPFAEY